MHVRELTYALVVSLLVFAAYVAAYYLLVDRVNRFDTIAVGFDQSTDKWFWIETYRYGDNASRQFFSLWNSIDRQLRPKYWSAGLNP